MSTRGTAAVVVGLACMSGAVLAVVAGAAEGMAASRAGMDPQQVGSVFVGYLWPAAWLLAAGVIIWTLGRLAADVHATLLELRRRPDPKASP